ncbi:hypothetical protein HALA3H3_950143 [Halomonas sp. A3H3]|nr:hypothetical protein HALA3H3_950143 [Halomonas sp. A3H3]
MAKASIRLYPAYLRAYLLLGGILVRLAQFMESIVNVGALWYRLESSHTCDSQACHSVRSTDNSDLRDYQFRQQYAGDRHSLTG